VPKPQAAQAIKKKKKSFEKMKDRARSRLFSQRVNVDDKSTVSAFMNQELKRHIDIFLEKQ